MARGKIAPDAAWLVRAAMGSQRIDDADKDAGDRQFRALLAVARAAREVVGPKHSEDIIPARPWNRLCRALARLDRARGRRP